MRFIRFLFVCVCVYFLVHVAYSLFLFLCFLFFSFSFSRRCLFFFFFPPPPFFFKFFGLGVIVALFFFFPLYFCLTRHDFFLGPDFYFLINWVIAFFFFWLFVTLFFNWPSFFNNGVWVNLYKLTFFTLPLFHSQRNKNERN